MTSCGVTVAGWSVCGSLMQYLTSFPPERTEEVKAAIARVADAAQRLGARMEISASPQFPNTFLCIWGPDWPEERSGETRQFIEEFLDESGVLSFSRRHGPGDAEWDGAFFGWFTDEALSQGAGQAIGAALGIQDIFLIVATTPLRSRASVQVYKTAEPYRAAFTLSLDGATAATILDTGRLPENSQGILEQIRSALRD